jgi:hypothetical protein
VKRHIGETEGKARGVRDGTTDYYLGPSRITEKDLQEAILTSALS